jgi:stage II sporulation protein D
MLKCIFILMITGFANSCFAKNVSIKVFVLSLYHPQKLVISTNHRVFHLDTSLQGEFFFQAKPGEDIEISVNDSIHRIYRGSIRVTQAKNELRVENITPLENYVAGVVAGEIGGSAEPEFIKAQAILARTYALNKSTKTVLSDLAYHQVFKGFSALAKRYLFYSAETAGMVLNSSGKIADVMYHAECGSAIYPAGEFWPVHERYILPSILPSEMLHGEEWQASLSREQLSNVFTEATVLKRLEIVPVIIDLGNQKKNVESFRLEINRIYGWNNIPSNEFIVQSTSDGWILKGKGRGHLVGLCQQQANQLAMDGWQYDQLLALFYPTLEIEAR